MRFQLIALAAFVALAAPGLAHGGEDSHMQQKEIKELERKAGEGNAAAARQLWTLSELGPGVDSEKWLRRAAELEEPEAQRWLAYMIRERGLPSGSFGASPQEAVLKLLTSAARTNGTAAEELGEAFYSGYLGTVDKDKKAREAFKLAVSHHNSSSWEHLASMLHKGEGGMTDQVEAYYLICLATQCTHPESVTGEELWVLRHNIESELSMKQMKLVWKRVDSYISKERKREGGRIYQPPFAGNGVSEEKWNEYRKVTDDFEAAERRKLKTSKGESGPGE
jgi:TPR repeat protein